MKLFKIQSFIGKITHIWRTEIKFSRKDSDSVMWPIYVNGQNKSSCKLMVENNNSDNLKCCFAALLLGPGILLLVIILHDTLHVYLAKPTDVNKQMNRYQSRFQTASLWLERTGKAGVNSLGREWLNVTEKKTMIRIITSRSSKWKSM